MGVPNAWFAEWLMANYLSVINDALGEIERPDVRVRFGAESAERRDPRRHDAAPATASCRPAWLNPSYTFDAFVTSSCNEFASAAAQAVAWNREP